MNALQKFLKYGTTAAVILVFSSMAFAQLPEGNRPKMGKGWDEQFNEVIKELNLTPKQQQAITQQRTQEKAQSQELRQKIKAVRDQITQELNKQTTDTARVNSLVAQLKELTGQRIDHQIKGIIALKKILTPEQFKMLNEKTEQGKMHRGGKK
jgi:Spy/CpxP family protein refolding chaperone